MDDQRPRHAARDLKGGRAVAVGVIPEGAGGMVRRDRIFIFEADSGIDRQQDVVAIARRIHPQPVAVEVGAVEAMRLVGLVVIVGAGRVGRKPVVKLDPYRLPRPGMDGRRDVAAVRLDARPCVASQIDVVPDGGRGIEDLSRHILDVEVEHQFVPVPPGSADQLRRRLGDGQQRRRVGHLRSGLRLGRRREDRQGQSGRRRRRRADTMTE